MSLAFLYVCTIAGVHLSVPAVLKHHSCAPPLPRSAEHSSDHMYCRHCSRVQRCLALHHASLFFAAASVRCGRCLHFQFVIPEGSSIRLRVSLCQVNPHAFLTSAHICFGFIRTCLISFRMSRSVYSQGRPLRSRVSPLSRNGSSLRVVRIVESGRLNSFAISAGE